MEKIEKIRLDEQRIKKFVEKAKKRKKYSQIELFSTEIDGKKYEVYLCFDKFHNDHSGEDYRCFYIFANAIDFFLCNDGSEFSEDIEESDEFVNFYPKERVNFVKIYEMAQSYTDNFIETINRQQEFIEKYGEEQETLNYEALASELVFEIWHKIGVSLNDFDPCSFEYLEGWLCGQIENKTANQNN